MIATTRTCLLCGHEDGDVAMRLVELTAAEQRRISVSVVVAEDRSGVKAFDQVDVAERYVSEPRCRDTRACAERVADLELAALTSSSVESNVAADGEDPLSWL